MEKCECGSSAVGSPRHSSWCPCHPDNQFFDLRLGIQEPGESSPTDAKSLDRDSATWLVSIVRKLKGWLKESRDNFPSSWNDAWAGFLIRMEARLLEGDVPSGLTFCRYDIDFSSLYSSPFADEDSSITLKLEVDRRWFFLYDVGFEWLNHKRFRFKF